MRIQGTPAQVPIADAHPFGKTRESALVKELVSTTQSRAGRAYEPAFAAVPAPRLPASLLPLLSAGRHASDSAALNCDDPRLLRRLMWRVFSKVVEKLIIDELSILKVHGLAGLYEDLCTAYCGNYSHQHRLEELVTVLERLTVALASAPGSPVCRQLGAYLGLVSPWLSSLSDQWLKLELAFEELAHTSSVLEGATHLIDITQRLLADPRLKKILAGSSLDSLDQGLELLFQALTQVRLWQALPTDAGVADHVQMFCSNPLLQHLVEHSVLQLAQTLSQVHRGYPGSGSLAGQMNWLVSTIGNPVLRETLRAPLDKLLGGAGRAEQVFVTFEFVEQCRRFPVRATLVVQGQWLLASSRIDSAAWRWLRPVQEALGADPTTLTLMNGLLNLNQGSQAPGQVFKDLTRTMIRPVAEMAVWQLAAQALPPATVQVLKALYQHSAAHEPWASRCQRMAASAVAIAKPYVVGALMGDPLAAVTVGYAQALQTHTSWQQTLKWFVANAPGEDRRLQSAYAQYLNVLLAWQVYQAWRSDDPLETEDRLRQLARQLKDYEVVKSYPQLEQLIDLLPLLPLLKFARQNVKAQPLAETWLQCCERGLQALAGSRNKTLLELGQRMSRQLDTWLADALLAGLYAMRMPGAQAAPTSGVVPGARSSGESSPAGQPLLLGGICLEALGLGAMGYALWEMRRAGATTHRADDADRGLISARSTAAGPTSMPYMLPLLVGVGAMVAGGGLLYRWTRFKAPAAAETSNLNRDERRVDVDSPIYTPYINELLARAKTDLLRTWGETSPSPNHRPTLEPNAFVTQFADIDARSLCELTRLDIQGPPCSASRTASTRHDRQRREINVVHLPGALGNTRSTRVDPAAEAVRRALTFDKYDADVAARFTGLRDGLIALASDLELTEEEKMHRYLIRFFRLLIIQIGLNESALVDLEKSGTDADSTYRATLRWMAALMTEAVDVFEKIPRTPDTAQYFEQWEVDSPWGKASHLLEQAFTIKDLSSQAYVEQWQAWSYPWSLQEVLSDYLDRPGLSNTENLWRMVIASEVIVFRRTIDHPAPEASAQTLPQLLVNTFKARIETLGCELYVLLNKNELSQAERLAREVAIAELDMRKFCLLNVLLDELESYDIYRRLTPEEATHVNYAIHQAVFEAKKRAVELVLQKFASDVPALDTDDKILAYTLIAQDSNVSDELRSYLHKAASLAFSLMTRPTSTRTEPYERWDNLISLNFTRAASATEYFRRIYEEEPAGYRGLDTFRKSTESDSWCEYYQQFIDYKDRFIDFDARRLSYVSLLGLGLTDYSISQMQPKRIVYASLETYFKLNPELKRLLNSGEQRNPQGKFGKMLDSPTQWPGTIGFIILADGSVLAMSGINFKVAVKLFDCQAVQSSRALQKICELPALPYRSDVLELEGKGLIETVLNPLFGDNAPDVLSANDHQGFPVLKAPREWRTWWQRTQREQTYSCSGSELLPAADEVMKQNLRQWVGLLKQVNKDNGFWGGMLSLLPLYAEIRDNASDPDHDLDANSIMWDIAGILLSIMPAISGMAKLGEVTRKIVIRTALSKLSTHAPLKVITRQTLVALVHNPEFMKLGLKGFAYAAYAGFDILAPLPPGLVVAPLIRGTTHIRRYLQTHADRPLETTSDVAAAGKTLAYTHPAWAQMTALGKLSVVSMPDKTITLRGSELGPGEVLEEHRALWQPVARRQPIVRRVGELPGYSAFDACAPRVETRRAKRAAHELCLLDRGYRVPANLLETGLGYKIYSVDTDFVVKDYLPLTDNDLPRRIQSAWNNSEAYRRLYNQLSNESITWKSFQDQGVWVSVRLRRLPGKSLSNLIKDGDLTAIEGIRLQASPVLVDGLVERLSEHGILLDYIHLNDIVYDAESRLFNLRGFDRAQLNPSGMRLNEGQVNISHNSIKKVFDEFYQRTEHLVADDFGLDTSPLGLVESGRLAVHRMRYLENVRLQQAGTQAAQFEYARINHRGFIVPKVSRLDSELKLTQAYNDPYSVLSLEQRGALSGFIENTRHHRLIQGSISVATKYARILHRGSIHQIIAPQTYLFTAAGAPSVEDGRCYQLVLGLAVAIKEKRVSNFFLNLYRSAARTDASRNEMIRGLDQLRTVNAADFLKPEFNGDAQGLEAIVSHLDKRNQTSLYTLSSASHAMLLGVTLDMEAPRTFYFYEPNVGLFTYPSAKLLNTALRRTLGTSAMSEQYAAFKTSSGAGYKLSRIKADALKKQKILISNHPGPGFRSCTVADLCDELNDLPVCHLGRVPSGRASRAIACMAAQEDIIAIEAIQEALFTRSVLPARAFESLLDIDARVLTHYSAASSMGESPAAGLLTKARQQLMRLRGQSQALPAGSMMGVEERLAYLNYLGLLMMAVDQMALAR